jgi:hypothetical protein
MGHSRTPTQNTAGDGFPADPIDGYVRALPSGPPATLRNDRRRSTDCVRVELPGRPGSRVTTCMGGGRTGQPERRLQRTALSAA